MSRQSMIAALDEALLKYDESCKAVPFSTDGLWKAQFKVIDSAREVVEMNKRNYDSTVARIAGNILSGFSIPLNDGAQHRERVGLAVRLARMVVAEVVAAESAASDTEVTPQDPQS